MSAARITHARQLPLDSLSTHVRMQQGVLRLDPLKVGVAGGTLGGKVTVDGNSDPAPAEIRLEARALELNKLFPGVKLTQGSFGKIHGDIDLKGRGNSVAQILGGSSGSVALLRGRGHISNLLMEIAGLDGGEIIKFLVSGDQEVALRCAAAAFDVKKGLMTARALVLDTSDTVIYGDGQINLGDEAMNLTLRPYPKDMSILSLRSPLRVGGTFARPSAGPDQGALAGRAGVALALAAVNPLLALAATVETGPGQDANCGPALREAASPYAAARIAAMSRPPTEDDKATLGGPPAPASDAKGGARGQPSDQAAAKPRDPADKAARQHAPMPPDKPYAP